MDLSFWLWLAGLALVFVLGVGVLIWLFVWAANLTLKSVVRGVKSAWEEEE